MKKLITSLAIIFVFFLAGCNKEQLEKKDGFYQAASMPNKIGWIYYLTFDIKDSKIINVDFNGLTLNKEPQDAKDEIAQEGDNYVKTMSGQWHKLTKEIEKYIEANQDFNSTKFNHQGYTDAISGVTINYKKIEMLLHDALAAGPVKQGSLKDGIYFAQSNKKDEVGFINTLGYFVNHGHILAAQVDAYKLVTSNDGNTKRQYRSILAQKDPSNYDLGNKAIATYDEQLEAIEHYLIEHQTLDNLDLNNDGKTDAISGATINIESWVNLFKQLSKESQ